MKKTNDITILDRDIIVRGGTGMDIIVQRDIVLI